MHELRPFAPGPTTTAFQVLCDLEFRPGFLEVRYRVQGPMDELALPMAVANPGFRDELWTTTCLEIFLQEAGQQAYEEWNFSPSGNWAHYQFQSYRQPDATPPRLEPLEPMQWIRNEHQLLLQVRIPLPLVGRTGRSEMPPSVKASEMPHSVKASEMPHSVKASAMRYGLTAVLHLKTGEKQYWALDHAGDKPDFHLAASFQGEGRPVEGRPRGD